MWIIDLLSAFYMLSDSTVLFPGDVQCDQCRQEVTKLQLVARDTVFSSLDSNSVLDVERHGEKYGLLSLTISVLH
jgi:hypothetical protein